MVLSTAYVDSSITPDACSRHRSTREVVVNSLVFVVSSKSSPIKDIRDLLLDLRATYLVLGVLA